jgi:putative restriction endonuclease
MVNAVFMTYEASAYDDLPEARYHFPKTYLRQVAQTKGDFIVYYEPRRKDGSDSSTGRQAYFALAEVVDIEEDAHLADHYYARLRNFLEFDSPVPFRTGGTFFEAALQKVDGSTNKGAFGRSVRLITSEEFTRIVRGGFVSPPDPQFEKDDRIAEDVPEYTVRPIVERIVSRKFRDFAFRQRVRSAYSNTCAMSGLRLINGGGRPEVQAAHIRPVEEDGPDAIRNGLALTGTVHWLFDRGLVSLEDNYDILISPHGVPNDLERLIRPDRKAIIPQNAAWRPHPTYLTLHRNFRFKR